MAFNYWFMTMAFTSNTGFTTINNKFIFFLSPTIFLGCNQIFGGFISTRLRKKINKFNEIPRPLSCHKALLFPNTLKDFFCQRLGLNSFFLLSSWSALDVFY